MSAAVTPANYPDFHRNRTNLAIHIVMVPVFEATTLGALYAAASGRWGLAGLLALGPAVSLAAQGIGHGREPVPPLPFRGPLDFVRRLLVEQFYLFPRFVLTGGWARAWRG